MSLYILDTDTLTLFQHFHPVVSQRIVSVPPTDLAVSIISVEEQLSGWYTALRQAKKPDVLARVYARLRDNVVFLSGRQILLYTEAAIQRYEDLLKLKLKVGKMDLKIAAIALENN